MTASPKHHRPAAASLAATPRDPTLEAVLSSPSRKELLQRSSHRGGAATARRPSTATNEATPHQTSRQRVQTARGSNHRSLSAPSVASSNQSLNRHAVGEKDPAVVRPTRFVTETQLYGSGQQNSKTASSVSCAAATTLGQEEKRRKHANFVNRLHRIRAQQDEYDALTAPLHDAFDLSQVRRTQTIH